jgi:hypothetical protein
MFTPLNFALDSSEDENVWVENGWKHTLVTPFEALLGLVLQYIQYNCSKSVVHLILNINFGFWAPKLFFYKNNVIKYYL